jgi:hypothetical protein
MKPYGGAPTATAQGLEIKRFRRLAKAYET